MAKSVKKTQVHHLSAKVSNLLAGGIVIGILVLSAVALRYPQLFQANLQAEKAPIAMDLKKAADHTAPIRLVCPSTSTYIGENSVDVMFKIIDGKKAANYKLVINGEEQFGSYDSNEPFVATFNTADDQYEVMLVDKLDDRSSNACKFKVMEAKQ